MKLTPQDVAEYETVDEPLDELSPDDVTSYTLGVLSARGMLTTIRDKAVESIQTDDETMQELRNLSAGPISTQGKAIVRDHVDRAVRTTVTGFDEAVIENIRERIVDDIASSLRQTVLE